MTAEIYRLVDKALALRVGEEFFQCYSSHLPDVSQLRKILSEASTEMSFTVWPTINGTIIKRES